MSQLSARLMVMRLAAQSTNVNVLKIVEDHPCLLLQETFALDEQASQYLYKTLASSCLLTGRTHLELLRWVAKALESLRIVTYQSKKSNADVSV